MEFVRVLFRSLLFLAASPLGVLLSNRHFILTTAICCKALRTSRTKPSRFVRRVFGQSQKLQLAVKRPPAEMTDENGTVRVDTGIVEGSEISMAMGRA